MNHTIRQFFLKVAKWLALGALTCNLAWAIEPFQMRDIRVEGLQRVEPGTVFASLPFRVGDTYTDEKGTAAIRGLFALGLFKDNTSGGPHQGRERAANSRRPG